MSDTLTTSPNDTAAPPSTLAPPRVSLLFLFVWTTVVAIFVAAGMAAFQVPAFEVLEEGQGRDPLSLTFIFTNSLVYGACLAAWFYAWERFRGAAIAFPTQPGHFFALLIGVQYIGTMLMMLLVVQTFSTEFGSNLVSWVFILTAGIYVAQAICWVFIHLAPFHHRAWKVFCCAMIAWNIFQAIGYSIPTDVFLSSRNGSQSVWFMTVVLPDLLSAAAWLCAAFAGLIATIQDFRRWREYNWLHWLGVSALAYQPLATAIVIIARDFVRASDQVIIN